VRANLMTYGQLARAGFRRQSQYRLAMLSGLLTNIAFGFIRAAVLFAALESAGGRLAGYDRDGISAYVWLSQGLLGAVGLGMAASEIGERIRSGDIAIELTRPVDVQLSYLAVAMGRAAYTFIPRGVPSVLVGALTLGLTLPTTVLPYVLGLVSIALAVALAFLVQFALVDVTGFWLVETRGVRTLYNVTCAFLAGLFVPVGFFPDWLLRLASATPFPSMLQSPIDVLSGRVLGADAVRVVLVQLAWVVVALVLGRAAMYAGRRTLVVQGG